jgi:bacteriorhodopsin
MSSFEITLHWIYVAIMFCSAIFFQVMASRPNSVPTYKYVIHTFVVVWSGLAYAAIALGQGSLEVNGQTVYYARYIDWIVSTPLLLLSLNLTGKYNIRLEGTITGALLGSQAIMIITGLVAELSTDDIKWFWYTAGCIALAVVLYLMWKPLKLKAESQNRFIAGVYRKSALFLTVQWLAYPLVWMIGSMGLQLLDATTTSILFIVLPVISKAGFGFFNLYLLRNLPPEAKR